MSTNVVSTTELIDGLQNLVTKVNPSAAKSIIILRLNGQYQFSPKTDVEPPSKLGLDLKSTHFQYLFTFQSIRLPYVWALMAKVETA